MAVRCIPRLISNQSSAVTAGQAWGTTGETEKAPVHTVSQPLPMPDQKGHDMELLKIKARSFEAWVVPHKWASPVLRWMVNCNYTAEQIEKLAVQNKWTVIHLPFQTVPF